ncbi:MAG TPA: hypothetical protein VES70_33620 [Pseudomonas sp.]|nr:hypothetical protein [Pseudomonas sp.]
MRYNTGNPVGPDGSSDPRDLYDNGGIFDVLINGSQPSAKGRLGEEIMTYYGALQQWQQLMLSSGYEPQHLTYVDGVPLVVARPTQLIDRAGSVYRVKWPASFPVSLTGNWAADQSVLVDVSDASLRASLALDSGAGMVGFSLDEIYSSDTMGSAIQQEYSGWVSAASLGLYPSPAVVDQGKLQAAIDSGIPIRWGPFTYLFNLTQNITLEAGVTQCANIWRGSVKWVGVPGKTILKLADNQSTDASPKFFNMFACNTVLTNMFVQGIVFDCNGQNNKISPNRGVGVFNRYNCAQIMVSGSVATGGADARIERGKILNCNFINSPGVTCIATGQRYNHPGVKGYDVEIAGCVFYNNGIDSADHSSIYAFGSGINVHDNWFDHPSESSGVQSPCVAVESFGSGNRIHNNYIHNYVQMFWVGAGEDADAHGPISVIGNQGQVSWIAIALTSIAPQDNTVQDVIISDNSIHVTAKVVTNPSLSARKYGIYLGVDSGAALRIKCHGNIMYCTDRSDNAGLLLSANTGASVDTSDIRNNLISGFSIGADLGAGGSGSLTNTVFDNNTIENCAASTATPVGSTKGIRYSGNNYSLSLQGNNISGGDLYSPPNTAIELTGTLTNLTMEGNSPGATSAANEIVSTVVVSGRRRGKQACTFAALPAQSTWQIGDYVEVAGSGLNIGTGGGLGAAGSKYIVYGWKRITSGTGNVLNTDWFEDRRLTGN